MIGQCQPHVSVVMPAFNTAAYIGAAIESVLAQSYGHWDLVIVDDGSTDDTGAIADRWACQDPARIRVIHQRNQGIAEARNRALEAVNPASELISFLDSDDVWFPNALSIMVDALQRDAGLVGVHGWRTYLDRNGAPIRVNGAAHAPLRRRAVQHGRLRTVPASAPTTFEVLAYGCCVFTGALLVRAEALKQEGRFDPAAVPAEDWDMWLRLSLRAPFGFIRAPLYGYRLHGNNSTASTVRKNASIYFVRHKFATTAAVPATRATMLAGFRWYEVYRAAVCFRALPRTARQDTRRAAAAMAWRGVRHLWSSVVPGRRTLASLARASATR